MFHKEKRNFMKEETREYSKDILYTMLHIVNASNSVDNPI